MDRGFELQILKCIFLSKLGSNVKLKVEKGRMVEETSLNDIYLALYQYYIKLTIYVFYLDLPY